MIIITHSFWKEVRHFSTSVFDELKTLITKHSLWLSKNLILLKNEGATMVLKGYLNGKRVRVIVLKTSKWNYVPLEILKKESRDGYNARSNYDANNLIDRMNREIFEDKYEQINI